MFKYELYGEKEVTKIELNSEHYPVETKVKSTIRDQGLFMVDSYQLAMLMLDQRIQAIGIAPTWISLTKEGYRIRTQDNMEVMDYQECGETEFSCVGEAGGGS